MTDGGEDSHAPTPDTHRGEVGDGGLQAAVCLPDFRNPGVLLRILVLAEVCNLLAFLIATPTLPAAIDQLANWNPLFEVVVLWVVLLLFVLAPWLRKLDYRGGTWATVAVSALAAAAVVLAGRRWLGEEVAPGALRSAFLAAGLCGLLLAYFDWRQRALSPALVQARLIALQARIRPHFLFNSINTVLMLLRRDSAMAERALLDLSDLFRAVLTDERGLVPLSRELELARSYAEIERLRLGKRFRLHWMQKGLPGEQGGEGEAACDPLVPMLILQPLLENAVRHGVEPALAGGDVWVIATREGDRLRIEVRNTVTEGCHSPRGNRMALNNIRERVSLHFDAAASISHRLDGYEYVVRVDLPVVTRDAS